MELTLRYKGLLPATTRTEGRIPEKHAIRKELHKQLEVFWAEDHRLKALYGNWKSLQIPSRSREHFEVSRPLKDATYFWWRWPLAGYQFIPLITHVHELHCGLSIRIYRKIGHGGILYEGGDLDNRLKTLLDALQVPRDVGQLPPEGDIDSNPDSWPPLFCLLDNDAAVTKLSIESFKLLSLPPTEFAQAQNYIELDIDVLIEPVTALMGNLDILFK